MRTDERGEPCPETLGEYRDYCAAFNADCAAVAFLDLRIAATPGGRDAKIRASDAFMRKLLYPLILVHRAGPDGDAAQTAGWWPFAHRILDMMGACEGCHHALREIEASK